VAQQGEARFAAVDLGGTNTDVLLGAADGTLLRSLMLPWRDVRSTAELSLLLAEIGARPAALAAVAVTGGRHRDLPPLLDGTPVLPVSEPEAIGRGGLLAAGLERALVMSMGTGTAMVAAGPDGYRHLGGTAVGGGTVLGLGRLLCGTADPARIGALAAAGNPRAVDLTVGDIVGGPVGVVPAEMTAAHFGKVARPEGGEHPVRPEDVAAGLLEMVGQVLGRLGLLAARAERVDALVLTGRLAAWPGIHRAVLRVAGTFGGRVIVPPEPGLATARGALMVAVRASR
jgi:type II pantothenate kinase